MADFRALCAELADELDHNRQCLLDDRSLTHPLADRARAALAEQAVEPNRRQLMMLADDMGIASLGDAAEYAHAVLARWGTRGESRLRRLQQENHRFREPERTILCDILANGTLLPDPSGKRYAAPRPIPVSERLPEAGDCDAERRCWWLKQRSNPDHDLLLPTWHLQRQGPVGSAFFRYTHWLPAHALPLPEGGE